MGSGEEFQVTEVRERKFPHEVRERKFPQRTKASHDLHVLTVNESDNLSSHFGVKGGCVLHELLSYSHRVSS